MLLSDLYLWLSYSHVATSKINRILDKMSPTELWDSFGKDTRYSLDEKTLGMLKRTHSAEFIERAKYYLDVNHVKYVTRADPAYPYALAQKEVDPPPVLYYKGDLELTREKCLAVVGTRRATPYGKYVTRRIVGELAGQFAIVSGLAAGIDGFAHAAALDCGGKTVAVLGSGLFHASPASNLKMFDEICEKGLALTEYPPDTHATEYTFPQRNRIISGLSKGVLVIEADKGSGALITADCALEQGRDVFAVPGDIDKPMSFGTNRLIKSGGTAVTCARDIFEYYSVNVQDGMKRQKHVALDFSEQRLLDILTAGEKTFDALVETCGMTVSEVNTALSSLLIYGLIHQKSKNLYCVSL